MGILGRLYWKRKHQLWQAASRFICVSDFMRMPVSS